MVAEVDGDKAYTPRSGVALTGNQGGFNFVSFVVAPRSERSVKSWLEERARLVFYAFLEEVAAPPSFGVRSGVGNTGIGVGVGGGGFGWIKVLVAAYA